MDRGLEDAFAGVHPAEEFFFFVVAIGAGMFLVHPLYVGVSFAAASLYFFLPRRRRASRSSSRSTT